MWPGVDRNDRIDFDRLAEEEFDQLCFDYGIELDDVVCLTGDCWGNVTVLGAWLRNPSLKAKVKMWNTKSRFLPIGRVRRFNDHQWSEWISSSYDLLCLEGLSRALKIFLQKYVLRSDPLLTMTCSFILERRYRNFAWRRWRRIRKWFAWKCCPM